MSSKTVFLNPGNFQRNQNGINLLVSQGTIIGIDNRARLNLAQIPQGLMLESRMNRQGNGLCLTKTYLSLQENCMKYTNHKHTSQNVYFAQNKVCSKNVMFQDKVDDDVLQYLFSNKIHKDLFKI